MLILMYGTNKYHLDSGQEIMGDAAVLAHCSSLRSPWQKPTGVLEHCCEKKPNVGSPFFGAIAFDRIPKAPKDANVPFLVHSFTSSWNSRK
jgi:hypothetical protein